MNKTIKNLIIFLLSLSIIFSLASCKSETNNIVIGISKIVAHPALDAVEKGIMDELSDLGLKNIKYDLQNANGEMSTAASIANKFKASKVNLAVGIATPTAQALVNTLKETPVVYSAVTDPVDAGLVESFDKGNSNVTGVSDMTPVKAQIELLIKLKKIKSLGHIYSSSEANAVSLAKMAEKACKELNINFVVTTVTNSAEVKQATQAIINKVDGIYLSTDNTVISAISAISDVALKNNIPIISADPSSAEKFDVLAAWGFDYYKMGRATGKIINDILNGKKPEEIPTKFMTEPSDVDLLINMDVAKKLGINIPEEISKTANKIVKDGKLTQK